MNSAAEPWPGPSDVQKSVRAMDTNAAPPDCRVVEDLREAATATRGFERVAGIWKGNAARQLLRKSRRSDVRTVVGGERSGGFALVDVLPLVYLALPSAIFLATWIRPAYGVPAAIALVAAIGLFVAKVGSVKSRSTGFTMAMVAVASAWAVMGGVGHLVYANFDWSVRDAVLLDLVRNPWPVVYDYGPRHLALLLRAPIGLYLPSALVGKVLGIRAADLTMLVWIVLGVLLVFWLMLRDIRRADQIAVRLAVFILFSGMDIVGNYSRHYPIQLGQHIEWWASIFQYPAMTTQLFWAPGHALPGWIAVAWLLGRGDRRLPIPIAVSLVALIPMWSPLAAIGVAPIIAVAVCRELKYMSVGRWASTFLDVRLIICVVTALALIFPYLVLGSETLHHGWMSDIPWVGEDFTARYVEFVTLEFLLLAVLLLWRFRLDPLLVTATVVLLAIPIYHFGPANDLALRTSNPGLALLAIRMGQWLSSRVAGGFDVRARVIAVMLLAIGAVTPFLEVSRLFTDDRWNMNTHDSLIEAAKGRPAPHYLTPRDQPWPDRFLR